MAKKSREEVLRIVREFRSEIEQIYGDRLRVLSATELPRK